MKFDSTTYRISNPEPLGRKFLYTGLVFLLLSAFGWVTNHEQFYFSYLVSFMFFITLGLGGLFVTLIHYLTHSVWTIVVKRIPETAMRTLPWMAIFFIPIIFGMHDLYHWTDYDAVAQDAILSKKVGYLNTPFFLIRAAVYFVIWFGLGSLIHKFSIQQDEGHESDIYQRLRRVAAPGMFLFALSLTFASFDWLMSLDPHWYSTIFGVYIFSGSYLTIIAFMTLFTMFIQRRGILKNEVTIEHYHDFGKLLFAFTVFWAYIAGSQYFLIWYGNIPEETVWFLHRWEGSWKSMSLFLIFAHFAVPFLVLIFRASKRNKTVLFAMASLILIMQFIDLYWIVMPTLHHHGVHFSWMDITTFVGIGGVFLFLFWKNFTANAIVPVKDEKLQDSIKFLNP
ncbi:MAG: hypothetical protein HQ509_11835 [Candidatus Marinimicrobia bacterium]|nr:hypothetical protein [Candidatus Neomarinimicrobiota bacterium]